MFCSTKNIERVCKNTLVVLDGWEETRQDELDVCMKKPDP